MVDELLLGQLLFLTNRNVLSMLHSNTFIELTGTFFWPLKLVFPTSFEHLIPLHLIVQEVGEQHDIQKVFDGSDIAFLNHPDDKCCIQMACGCEQARDIYLIYGQVDRDPENEGQTQNCQDEDGLTREAP